MRWHSAVLAAVVASHPYSISSKGTLFTPGRRCSCLQTAHSLGKSLVQPQTSCSGTLVIIRSNSS
ncbi:hypothetical protein DPMN_039689 [Dreissena polymorpha]|uniref:Uncharacterized protein n=1 Tax=Dreissena polymorpha TaxID=45954 RepID=A0A9D4CWC8_DREPO|nr:hypothetical protein DPMN_039689 [Dreissena polymorpha]